MMEPPTRDEQAFALLNDKIMALGVGKKWEFHKIRLFHIHLNKCKIYLFFHSISLGLCSGVSNRCTDKDNPVVLVRSIEQIFGLLFGRRNCAVDRCAEEKLQILVFVKIKMMNKLMENYLKKCVKTSKIAKI